MVGAAGEDPRLCGVELTVEHAQLTAALVSSQDLDRHNERVLQQVTVKHSKHTCQCW